MTSTRVAAVIGVLFGLILLVVAVIGWKAASMLMNLPESENVLPPEMIHQIARGARLGAAFLFLKGALYLGLSYGVSRENLICAGVGAALGGLSLIQWIFFGNHSGLDFVIFVVLTASFAWAFVDLRGQVAAKESLPVQSSSAFAPAPDRFAPAPSASRTPTGRVAAARTTARSAPAPLAAATALKAPPSPAPKIAGPKMICPNCRGTFPMGIYQCPKCRVAMFSD